MAMTNILVPLDGSPGDGVSLATALAAAWPFHCHVSALFASSDENRFLPAGERQSMPEHGEQIRPMLERKASVRQESAREFFAAGVLRARAKIAPMAQKSIGVTASYREVSERLLQAIDADTHFADLVVLPPLAGAQDGEMHGSFIHTLLKLNRPVLLSPKTAPEHVGEKIAIGWDGGLAASHALLAALPFVEACGSVDLLCVRRQADPMYELDEVKEYFALHGVKTAVRMIARTAQPIGETLLDAATRLGCDLIAIGGYGHSRTLESIIGGVTEDLASNVRIPVLMVH